MSSPLDRTRFLNIVNPRDEVERGDIEPALKRLAFLEIPEAASTLRQGIFFTIDGYNDDPRELYEVPEVREWMARLDARWPYWFFFLFPGFSSSLGFVTFSLCPVMQTPSGPDVEQVAFCAFTDRHLDAMDRICALLGDSEEDNLRMINSIAAFYTGIDENAVETEGLKLELADRQMRAATVIEICNRQLVDLLPEVLVALNKMTWGEIEEISPYLPKFGLQIVEPLCSLLISSRKQTITAVTSALAALGDARACQPLVDLMVTQANDTNALRARDALIQLGSVAAPAVMSALDSPNWAVRCMSAQCLGAIGDDRAVERLEEIGDTDRSSKVREAALEALDAISAYGRV